MTRQIVVGIDIGTSLTKVVIAEGLINHAHVVPTIIGTGSSESKGVRRGYIENPEEAAKSIELALKRAEKMAGLKVKKAYVSFGGMGLSSIVAHGSVVISRADSEITERDLTLALEAAETAIPPAMALNKKIINTVPIEYKIDGKLVWGETVGLKAPKLEVKALFIACQEQHLSSLIHTVEMAGVEVVDVIAAPVALSCVALSKKQKRAGCLLVDLGAETLSMVVFENNNLISLEVFPFGGDDVTNDIALGLKISPDDAENIKRGTDRRLTYPRKKIEDIIRSRLVEYFAHVETHLKAIGRNALLPAGVIIAGGGALTMEIKDVAEHALKLPSQLVEVSLGTSTDGKIKDHTWAVACGLAIIGLQTDGIEHSLGIHNGTIFKENSKRWGKAFLRWISQFLP